MTSSVRALGSQRFIASFTSHEAGMHTVQITFNGDTVPGKNFWRVFERHQWIEHLIEHLQIQLQKRWEASPNCEWK